MAGIGYRRIHIICIAACVAAVSFLAAIPVRAIAWVREQLVGLVDARPFNDLFRDPMLAVAGPSNTPVDAALLQRSRHEAGFARLGTVRHI